MRADLKATLLAIFSFVILTFSTLRVCSGAISKQHKADSPSTLSGKKNEPVFVFQDNFWVNLHHFLRAEAWRQSRGIPLELSPSTLKPDEQAQWESALGVYAPIAKRSFVFDELLVEIDNELAKQSGPTIGQTTAVDAELAAALNEAAPTYRESRWKHDHVRNEDWITVHASSLTESAQFLRAKIGLVFGVKPPDTPILVDVVEEVGPNLAYTTKGPEGFSGHTFISPLANHNPDVALDTIAHEISHTMDDQIIANINAEAARQQVQIPTDMWHAMTLYTTGELVRIKLGRRRDDPSYAPNQQFFGMFADGSWSKMFANFQTYWLPYLNGEGKLSEALGAVIRNASR